MSRSTTPDGPRRHAAAIGARPDRLTELSWRILRASGFWPQRAACHRYRAERGGQYRRRFQPQAEAGARPRGRARVRSEPARRRPRLATATPPRRAQSLSFIRFAPTRIRSAGDSPKSLMPSGQTSGSSPIQTTAPAARARISAQNAVAAPGSPTSTSWKAASASPPPGSTRSIGGQRDTCLAWIVAPPRSSRATAARSSTRAVRRSTGGSVSCIAFA